MSRQQIDGGAAITPRRPRGTSGCSLSGRSRVAGFPYIAVAGSATTTFGIAWTRMASSSAIVVVNARPNAIAFAGRRGSVARWNTTSGCRIPSSVEASTVPTSE